MSKTAESGNQAISQIRAVVELVVAGALWGFGFVATRYALESFDSIFLTGFRFVFATVLLSGIVFFSSRLRKRISREEFFLALLPGFFMSASLVLQTVGLVYTTVTNSGFITVMYVVFVPILEVVFFARAAKGSHIFAILLALFGAALLSQVWNIGSINYGDALTLMCAFMFAVQIVLVERASSRFQSPFLFNFYQSFWAAVVLLFLALNMNPVATVAQPFMATSRAWLGMLFLVIGSTMIAFLIQMRAQRVLPSSTASMLFLLESPFAALFGFWILSERLNMVQWTGAVLILFAAVISVRFGLSASKPGVVT